MPAYSLQSDMPPELRLALKKRVISYQEAEQWHLHYQMQQHLKLMEIPESLHPAINRMWLFQQAGRKH